MLYISSSSELRSTKDKQAWKMKMASESICPSHHCVNVINRGISWEYGKVEKKSPETTVFKGKRILQDSSSEKPKSWIARKQLSSARILQTTATTHPSTEQDVFPHLTLPITCHTTYKQRFTSTAAFASAVAYAPHMFIRWAPSSTIHHRLRLPRSSRFPHPLTIHPMSTSSNLDTMLSTYSLGRHAMLERKIRP